MMYNVTIKRDTNKEGKAMKNCKHLAPKDYRIALYDPADEIVHASYATLAEAMKDYDIPADIEFEQGLGALFIAVPYSARKTA